jgi:hypothetical protein
MFPVPKFAAQVEQEWSEDLAAHLSCALDAFRANPTAHMLYPNQTVRVELKDGSLVQFKHSFAIVSPAKRAVAVFTEHCGHHVFPYHEARVFRDGKLCYEQRGA